jgi:hypothetical protein
MHTSSRQVVPTAQATAPQKDSPDWFKKLAKKN